MTKIYRTNRWRTVRARVLRKNPLCEYCKEAGLTVEAVDVDHRIPLADGGKPFAVDNLQSVCKECHEMKTRFENQARRKGHRTFAVDRDGGIIGGRPE